MRRRATEPHDIWQVGAAVGVRLGDGTRARWPRVADEFTGAVPHTAVCPPRAPERRARRRRREQLRGSFRRRGLPRAIRVDNGTPWGSAGDFPTDLAPRLIGLGVGMIWNPPQCPRASGVVERPQGTGKRRAGPATCAGAAESRRRVGERDALRREVYPSTRGRGRVEAYPGLRHSGRPDRSEEERGRREIGRVVKHLAGYVVVRRVDRRGTFSLYNTSRYVTRAWPRGAGTCTCAWTR